jgi:D-glycero-D-manno-heptose 1,7-bisphosphate phosphatase
LTDDKVLRPAVFLDRDGTICEEVGYLNHISRLQVYPYAAAAIRRLNDARVPTVVVTNQSGIARKMFPESLVLETHRRIAAELAQHGAWLDGFYYCAHMGSDGCACRKPLPGLVKQAAEEHAIDLGRSYVVGDRYVDVALAHGVGAKALMVMSGFGRGEYELHKDEWGRQPDWVAENLQGAVEIILKELE